ncbi:MAG: polysaccharide deacetylase family protein [Anaerolineales bacterium]|nr:polysaccharide deacetylase family protein [Anaerolineales bacterium]
MTRFTQKLFPNSLTVLNYHRIDWLENNQDMFQPNISASPQAFDEQMAFVKKWYRVISLQELTDWLLLNKPLPPLAALITFDDGYLDNYTNAFPILKKYDFSAVIYLTSGYIASNRPFYWDLASYCFFHTQTDCVQFPDSTQRRWSTNDEKKEVLKAWIEAMKLLKEGEKQKWVSNLPEALSVSIPHEKFNNVMLNWNQIREMHSAGIEFGAHTVNHPILTRISLLEANQEIMGSKKKIEEELGEPITSLAYPNGMKADFNNDVAYLTKEAGLSTAFTLLSGPTSLSSVKQSPYTIRRIFLSHRHSVAHFSFLLSPFNRIRSI